MLTIAKATRERCHKPGFRETRQTVILIFPRRGADRTAASAEAFSPVTGSVSSRCVWLADAGVTLRRLNAPQRDARLPCHDLTHRVQNGFPHTPLVVAEKLIALHSSTNQKNTALVLAQTCSSLRVYGVELAGVHPVAAALGKFDAR